MNIFDADLMEKLAEAAHDVWMGKPRKLHACLVPWAQLSEQDKQSDRDLVVGIPVILKKAGLRIEYDTRHPSLLGS